MGPLGAIAYCSRALGRRLNSRGLSRGRGVHHMGTLSVGHCGCPWVLDTVSACSRARFPHLGIWQSGRECRIIGNRFVCRQRCGCESSSRICLTWCSGDFCRRCSGCGWGRGVGGFCFSHFAAAGFAAAAGAGRSRAPERRRDRVPASGSRLLAARGAEWPHRPRQLGVRMV